MGLVGSATFGFNDGDTGKSCDFGSAPNVGEVDVLSVASDTTVDTPTGFTVATSFVSNMGGYTFYREAVGGEASTVSINTTGDHPTAVVWTRLDSINAFDVAAEAHADSSLNTVAPALSTGALAEENEHVVTSVLLHSCGTNDQNTPVWGGGFTAVNTASFGTGATSVRVFVGYRTDAGTAAASPTLSWSGSGVQDRYIQTAAFTSLGGAVALPGGTVAAQLNRLAGTSGLTATAAANVWAGTSKLTLTAALNAKAATSKQTFVRCCNILAGTTDLTAADALSRIP